MLGPHAGVPLQPYPAAAPYPYPPVQPYSAFAVQSAPVLPSPVAQPANYSNRRRLTASKQPAIFFIALTVVILALSVASLVLREWVDLCSIEVGLTDGSFSGQHVSLNTLKDAFCSYPIEDFMCGNLCSDLKDLILAGKVMRGLGIAATVFTGLALFNMALLLLRPERLFRRYLLRIVLLASMISWEIGAFLYVGYYVRISENSLYKTVGPGLGIAISVAVLHLINCVLGNLAISRLI